MKNLKYTYDNLPIWYREMFNLLLSVEFPGRSDVEKQLKGSEYTLIDDSGSLSISNPKIEKAETIKTIPVEAYANDIDGIRIQVLLFMRKGKVDMLELLRGDGFSIIEKPDVSKFQVLVLGK